MSLTSGRQGPGISLEIETCEPGHAIGIATGRQGPGISLEIETSTGNAIEPSSAHGRQGPGISLEIET